MGLDITFNLTKSSEIGYFRKVNFLVSFFEEVCKQPIENLVPVEITKYDCKDLLDRCNKVLESKTEKVSKELLPTCPGFFFGSYEYDENYYKDVESVRHYLIETLIPMFDELDANEKIEFEIWY